MTVKLLFLLVTLLFLLDTANDRGPEIKAWWRRWRERQKIKEVWWEAHVDNDRIDQCTRKVACLKRCGLCGQGEGCLYNTTDLECGYDAAHRRLARLRNPPNFDLEGNWSRVRKIEDTFEQFILTRRASVERRRAGLS